MPRLDVTKVEKPIKSGNKLAKFLKGSDEFDLDRCRIVVFGPPGVGKTWAAGTIDSNWPDEIPSKEKAILSKTLWVSFDSNATSGFREANIKCPYVFDIRDIIENEKKENGKRYNFLRVQRNLLEMVEEAVKTLDIQNIVIDTISALDGYIVGHWFDDRFVLRGRGDIPDSQKTYGEVAKTHREFWEGLDYLPVRMVFLAHCKEITEPTRDDSGAHDKKMKAVATPGEYIIRPAITGKSINLYTHQADLLMSMQARKDRKTKKWVRHLYPESDDGFAGKNRWQFSLSDAEEPHLGKILDKVRKNNS